MSSTFLTSPTECAMLVTLDLENNEVQYAPGSAIKCANGFLQFNGKACFRAQTCATSESVSTDDCLKILLRELDACSSVNEIIGVLDDLIGGWSVVYCREDLSKIFVGRDVFGRKSLLWTHANGRYYFSCFACNRKYEWRDVPSGTITVLDVCGQNCNKLFFVFDNGGSWADQFNKLDRIQREMVLKRLMLSHKRMSEQVNHEVMGQMMLEQLRGAVRRTLNDVNCTTECISISFSGGADSLLIAHVIAQCIPRNVVIHLVNVAFHKAEKYDEAPDRPQSIKAYQFLKSRYPERHFRLVLINVDLNELTQCRKKFIASAVAPSCSVLDDSIGCVLWFAARGEGFLLEEQGTGVFMKSEARIVVVGSGADEIFGGYMRHRTTYLREGREAVLNELYEELQRIGERNLGRDDRVASSLGKSLRAPFLDDVFVEWAISLPLECKTDFSRPRGIGEKWLLREALKLLGTPEALCTTPKRAMQFGSRVAKLENRREKGDDQCLRLLEE